jgi:hypothetical protein
VGSGGVHCLDLAWHLVVGGSLAGGPPPTDWVVHARNHLPIFLKLNIQGYWCMYSKARGWMGVSLHAWHTGVGVDKCQPPRPLMGWARTRIRIHWPTWQFKFQTEVSILWIFSRLLAMTYVCVHN